MRQKTCVLALSGVLFATTAASAPIDALSELELFHFFTINSGNQPSNVSFSFAPALDLSQSIETTVNAAGTSEVPTQFTQVGALGPPAVPFIAQRELVEQTPDGQHVAGASFDVSVLSETDPDEAPTNFVTRRTVETSGAASLTSADGTVSGDAASGYLIDRFYTLTNTAADGISFNIAGEFDARLLASFQGEHGFARTSLNYRLDIDGDQGVDVTYFPTGTYTRDIVDADTGATVTESFVTSNTGFLLSAATSAFADGGTALATYEGGFRYILGISMDPGSTLILNDRFVQSNAVEYSGTEMTPIPLPASLPILGAGLLALLTITHRRRSPHGRSSATGVD